MSRKHLVLGALLLVSFYACEKGLIEPFVNFREPSNFPAAAYHFNTNQVTKDGFELGRKLFYEKMLSATNTISCGTCHVQSSAFTHHGDAVSKGIFDRLGTRNSPPVMNLAWDTNFMWDGHITDLDLQPMGPISNPLEMGETMANVLSKLQGTTRYPALFKKAFGTDQINENDFLKALSQFMVMCVSSNSKYDSVTRNEGNATFTEDEQEGRILVKEKCGSCHKEPLFTDNSFRNIGVGISAVNDEGRYIATKNDNDKYKFKVPSLRNLAFTAPYMHDGSIATLDEVMEHYVSQVQNTPNLDPQLIQNGVTGIPLTPGEKAKMISFLNTLNDESFINDKRLSEF